ncbi:MAG TPA: hypothetical protein VN882_08390 [Steroidobacteraceae bacterium]|jgi:hypothetical protein|nr:hypothetical protein [Steroidobacteraceae bacterium]
MKATSQILVKGPWSASATSILDVLVRRTLTMAYIDGFVAREPGAMKKPGLLSMLVLLGLPALADAQGNKPTPYPAMAPLGQYLIADAHDEIALARSAAPPSISADAEVLVLGKHGYATAIRGTNGFVCFVERSWAAGFDDAGFWNPKIRAPNCFNPPAVRSVLPQYLRRTEWVLAGMSKAQMIEAARTAVANRRSPAPEAGSFSFMLSRNGYLGDDAAGPWLPHVMLFVPHGQAAVWAAGLKASPILGADGLPFEPTVLFIPVRRWSDGSPAPLPATEHQHSP